MSTESQARRIKQAMDDLRARRITPDEFRAVMAESRKLGEAQHDFVKAAAIAASNR